MKETKKYSNNTKNTRKNKKDNRSTDVRPDQRKQKIKIVEFNTAEGIRHTHGKEFILEGNSFPVYSSVSCVVSCVYEFESGRRDEGSKEQKKGFSSIELLSINLI